MLTPSSDFFCSPSLKNYSRIFWGKKSICACVEVNEISSNLIEKWKINSLLKCRANFTWWKLREMAAKWNAKKVSPGFFLSGKRRTVKFLKRISRQNSEWEKKRCYTGGASIWFQCNILTFFPFTINFQSDEHRVQFDRKLLTLPPPLNSSKLFCSSWAQPFFSARGSHEKLLSGRRDTWREWGIIWRNFWRKWKNFQPVCLFPLRTYEEFCLGSVRNQNTITKSCKGSKFLFNSAKCGKCHLQLSYFAKIQAYTINCYK